MRRFAVVALVALAATPVPAARRVRLTPEPHVLRLPGAPASIVATDLDGDGRNDLLVVVAYTEWSEIGFDRVEDMVLVTTVVPALFDRRELHAFLSNPDGSFEPLDAPLEMSLDVLSLEKGPPGMPAVALTSRGVSRVRFDREARGAPALVLEPILEQASALAGAGSFFPRLDLVRDVDGDGIEDLLFPGPSGFALFLGSDGGFSSEPVVRLRLPADELRGGGWRRYPLPSVQDLDGDGILDLWTTAPDGTVYVLGGMGGGRFLDPVATHARCFRYEGREDSSAGVVFVGDLEGDGRAELVTMQGHEVEGGMRKELKAAKNPKFTYAFHRLRDDRTFDPMPYAEISETGYPFAGEWPDFSGNVFRDLDGDGRRDLVTMTLDFSMLQLVRVLATKKISIGLDFHVFAQDGDGSFRKVPGLDLSEKLKLDLDDLRLSRMGQFSGDFDGDGTVDFVHLGRGRTVTVHRGQPGCRYPKKPDLALELESEVEDLGLVRIEDLDGDGMHDLVITRPLPAEETGASGPAMVEIYATAGVEEGP